jgi:hypothetical protein
MFFVESPYEADSLSGHVGLAALSGKIPFPNDAKNRYVKVGSKSAGHPQNRFN